MKPPLRICRIGHRKNAAKKAAVTAKMVRAKVCDIGRERGGWRGGRARGMRVGRKGAGFEGPKSLKRAAKKARKAQKKERKWKGLGERGAGGKWGTAFLPGRSVGTARRAVPTSFAG